MLALICAVPFAAVVAEESISVHLNGSKISMTSPPVMEGGRVLTPFRSIFEALGLNVSWDASTRTVTGTKEGKTIQLSIGSRTATVDGNKITLDVAPKIANGATLVPLRFVAESSGLDVKWNSAQRQALLTGTVEDYGEDYDEIYDEIYDEGYNPDTVIDESAKADIRYILSNLCSDTIDQLAEGMEIFFIDQVVYDDEVCYIVCLGFGKGPAIVAEYNSANYTYYLVKLSNKQVYKLDEYLNDWEPLAMG